MNHSVVSRVNAQGRCHSTATNKATKCHINAWHATLSIELDLSRLLLSEHEGGSDPTGGGDKAGTLAPGTL